MFLYLFLCFSHNMQVKPKKKNKKDKPAQTPVVTEPEQGIAAPDSSTHQPPPEPAQDIAAPTSDPPAEDILDGSVNPEAPSPVKTADPEVEFLKAQFVEPARPTVLAKCSAEEELLERRKAKMDITDYTHLSIGEIVRAISTRCKAAVTWKLTWWSKYSKNLRYDLCFLTSSHTYCTSPQVYCLCINMQ